MIKNNWFVIFFLVHLKYEAITHKKEVLLLSSFMYFQSIHPHLKNSCSFASRMNMSLFLLTLGERRGTTWNGRCPISSMFKFSISTHYISPKKEKSLCFSMYSLCHFRLCFVNKKYIQWPWNVDSWKFIKIWILLCTTLMTFSFIRHHDNYACEIFSPKKVFFSDWLTREMALHIHWFIVRHSGIHNVYIYI